MWGCLGKERAMIEQADITPEVEAMRLAINTERTDSGARAQIRQAIKRAVLKMKLEQRKN